MTGKSNEVADRMTPVQRRNKARIIRRLLREEMPMNKAAEAHGVSRAHAYRIIEELDKWEDTATFQQEADDLHQDPRLVPYFGGEKWSLLSGRMILAYAHGELDAVILNAEPDRQSDIAVQHDPLLG